MLELNMSRQKYETTSGPTDNLENTYRSPIAEYHINSCDCAENFSGLAHHPKQVTLFILKYWRQFIFCQTDHLCK